MSNIRRRTLFLFAFSAFAVAAIGTGYHHLFGKGYCRPVLVTEEKILDLGTVPADSLAEIEFFVSNGGVRPLRIESVRSGCAGCVEVLSVPRGLIRRNQRVAVRVALNTESLAGKTRKSVLIISNDPINGVFPMRIDADVERKEETEECVDVPEG